MIKKRPLGICKSLTNYDRNILENKNSNTKVCLCQQKENMYICTPYEYFVEGNTYKRKKSTWTEMHASLPKPKEYEFKSVPHPFQKRTEYRDYIGKLGKSLVNNKRFHQIFPRYVIKNKEKYPKWPIKQKEKTTSCVCKKNKNK